VWRDLPFYPPYVNIPHRARHAAGGHEAGQETLFQPSGDAGKLDPPPDRLIVASPRNPAGTVHPTS
jgi:hypothetical protein